HSRARQANFELHKLTSRCAAFTVPALVTVPHVIRTVAEKQSLGNLADAADMESLPLMDFWSDQSIPSLAVRVILDPVEAPLTFDFESTMNDEGQIQISKILGQVVRNPRLLPELIHLARENRKALGALADFLDRFFTEWSRS